jgi:integrase
MKLKTERAGRALYAAPRRARPPCTRSGGDELRALTALRKECPDSGYVFTTERGTPFAADAINRLVKTIGQRAELTLPVHFHMLRHSCGYKLANDGVDTRAIQDWLRSRIPRGTRR